MRRKTFRGRLRTWRALRWPVRLGLPILLSLTSVFIAWAIVTDLTVVKELHPSQAEHVDQAALLDLVREGETHEAFEQAFELGDELFEIRFSAVDGVGANVGRGQRFSRVPRADLKGSGEWFNHTPERVTGPNAQACNECHNAPFDDGAGEAASNVIRDPFRTGQLSAFINRNTPHVFAPGAIQRLAEEMTAALHQIRQNAVDSACRRGAVRMPLTVQGISFGVIRAMRTQRFPCKVNVDTSGVNGVAPDLIIRPFQWKGSVAFLRDFVRGAGHNELGMQGVEIAGDHVDGDFDGVADELTIGDVTALTVYQAAQPRPTTLLELAQLGLIEPLPPEQVNAIHQGSTIFAQIGCTACHVPTLKIGSPIFSEPSQNPNYRDDTFPAGQHPMAVGVDPAFPITFDLTKDQPDNVFITPSGDVIRLGSLKVGSDGQAMVELFGDLMRHDLGPELAEQVDEEGTGASVFLTENLWGVGSTAPYLHDGRATTLTEAILEHGGEAAASRKRFKSLSLSDQQAMITFLNNLILFKDEKGLPPAPPNIPTSTNPPDEQTATPTSLPTPTQTPVDATPTAEATPTPTDTPTKISPPSGTNLALNKPAMADSQCNANEGPAQAVNGSVSGGASDKWCSRGQTKWLQVDLEADHAVARFVVQHAGAGGERAVWNTRDFDIQVSADGANWTTVVTVTGNTASTTTHMITATTARYVQLNITAPQQFGARAARIYELEVYSN